MMSSKLRTRRGLTLALFVPWVIANNHHLALSSDNPALGAARLDRCGNLHRPLRVYVSYATAIAHLYAEGGRPQRI